jgi:hypothetical protein
LFSSCYIVNFLFLAKIRSLLYPILSFLFRRGRPGG